MTSMNNILGLKLNDIHHEIILLFILLGFCFEVHPGAYGALAAPSYAATSSGTLTSEPTSPNNDPPDSKAPRTG